MKKIRQNGEKYIAKSGVNSTTSEIINNYNANVVVG
jgi:hypothetical protein